MTIGDQTPAQSSSSALHVANDPKSQRVAQPNNKPCDDTSFKTPHLFLKIKVLRPPVETTGRSCAGLDGGEYCCRETFCQLRTESASRIGDAIIGHPLVRYVNFTGSVDVGRHVIKAAAENITQVTLELGGNDAGIICHGVDLSSDAFQRLHCAAFMSTGQICYALKRFYVHKSRFDEVAEG